MSRVLLGLAHRDILISWSAGDDTARCTHAAGVKDTYLCRIPILAQGEALGILHFQATDEIPARAKSELSFKTTFAEQVGLSVANLRLREALRTQSIRDPLTGLYNRRYLEEMLDREVRRAVRSEQSLGILMLDLDHFKKFNDTYGHDAGDAVLRGDGVVPGQEHSRGRRRLPLWRGRVCGHPAHRGSGMRPMRVPSEFARSCGS